jgi:hypothetical protein
VEKILETHKILRSFNVRPLYLVVKSGDSKTEVDSSRAGSSRRGHEPEGAHR